ncbi:MAG: DUF3048 domain-containing protein [Acidimicrobiia bacterium]
MKNQSQRISRVWLGALAVLSFGVAACGGNGESAEPTTTVAPTSTTSTTEATTTTTEEMFRFPLSGELTSDQSATERVAMIVKVDNNNANARPQRGLVDADIVVEESVEGGESRFLAVFHSKHPDPVGPVRSARTSDIDLMALFGRASFSSSGGNSGTMRMIRDQDLAIFAGHDSQFGGLFFRNGDGEFARRAPHNLFINLTELYNAISPLGSPPPMFAEFRDDDEPRLASATTTAGVQLRFGHNSSTWRWDGSSQTFLREQQGTPHIDAEGRQIGATNVLLLVTPYGTSPFDPTSPEAISVGSGEAWLLSDGHVTYGKWSRADRSEPYLLTDETGKTLKLLPGQTWVELLRKELPPEFLAS